VLIKIIAEKQRISAAGGYVEYGRVNGRRTESPFWISTHRVVTGNLALSRALGDFEYKKNSELTPEAQIITANPDIIVHELADEDEFFVIACDGRSDYFPSITRPHTA
jgi:protein phosphatase PTC2/3